MTFIFIDAWCAGLSFALLAGPLGAFVVWQRLSFFGDALAHAALLGVAIALMCDIGAPVGVLGVALTVACLLTFAQDSRHVAMETWLAIIAQGFLALTLVVMTFLKSPIDLNAYLFGDMLTVSRKDVYQAWLCAIGGLVVLAFIWRPLLAITVDSELAAVEGMPVRRTQAFFMMLIALAVTVASKLVGVLLFASLLILPPTIVRPWATAPLQMVILSSVAGFLIMGGGFFLALCFDTPPAPTITLTALGLLGLSRIIFYSARCSWKGSPW